MLNEVLEQIKKYDTIIIHRHERPDGDCIGCQMGLKYFLQHNFPDKHIYAPGDMVPQYLQFNGLSDEVKDDLYANALVFVLDTSTKARICDKRYENGAFIVKIDHHDDSEPFGDIEYVDPTAPACSQIITLMLNSWGLEMPIPAATALYTALVSDTGRFRFRGVDQNTFEAASILVKTGIDIVDIYAKMDLKEINTYRLKAYLFKHMKSTPNGVMYMYFTKHICKKFNISREDAAALVSEMSSIKGYPAWIAFTDYPDNIRVRLRSRYLPINEIGKMYRGGGHLQAAGGTIYNKKEMRQLLKDADKLVAKYKLEHPEVQ